jgi:hypothetical protein
VGRAVENWLGPASFFYFVKDFVWSKTSLVTRANATLYFNILETVAVRWAKRNWRGENVLV